MKKIIILIIVFIVIGIPTLLLVSFLMELQQEGSAGSSALPSAMALVLTGGVWRWIMKKFYLKIYNQWIEDNNRRGKKNRRRFISTFKLIILWVKRHIPKNKYFYLHLSLATTTLILLFVGWMKYLDYYTMHDKYIKVPKFKNMLITQVDSVAKANNIRCEKTIIFDRNKKKGIVISQDPPPFTDVKKNRKIYLTINSLVTKKVVFPDINDVTPDEAKTALENLGLAVGKESSIAHISTNVRYYKLNGDKIKIGDEIAEGTIIDLVVGNGLGKESVIEK